MASGKSKKQSALAGSARRSAGRPGPARQRSKASASSSTARKAHSGPAAQKRALRIRRHARVRKHVIGTPERPRLAVFRSARHITAQVIDDSTGRTLASASTTEPALRSQPGGNVEGARAAGHLVAQRASEAGIRAVVFDRGGYKYHGRVAALADAAREAGLEI